MEGVQVYACICQKYALENVRDILTPIFRVGVASVPGWYLPDEEFSGKSTLRGEIGNIGNIRLISDRKVVCHFICKIVL